MAKPIVDYLAILKTLRSHGLDETVELEIGGGLKVRVLSLERLVKTKEETGQEKES
jgi:hypothetical protein